MTNGDTQWTPGPEDNLLGLTDAASVNEEESIGMSLAQVEMYGLDINDPITVSLLLDVHRIAFGRLYDWAGKWRTVDVVVGSLQPPQPHQVPQLMYQFLDNLNFKISIANSREDHLACLFYAHHEFIRIHPFTNGNGRTGRLLMNVVALKFGYNPLILYHREGESRKIYIEALKAADRGDEKLLLRLINDELSAY